MKKKIVLYILSCFCLFTSCDVETNEEPGGTSIEKMAGTLTRGRKKYDREDFEQQSGGSSRRNRIRFPIQP